MGVFSRLGSTYKNFINGYSNDHVIDKSLSSQFSMSSLLDYVSHQQLVKSAPVRKGRAFLADPTGQIAAMGYMDRPYSLSYDTLRDMSTKNAVIAAIINTRVNQVSTFTRPARFDKAGIGYEIALRDPKRAPTKSEEREILDYERFLEYTGYYKDPMRDSFDTFIRKITRDRLTYDQVNFEIVPDRAGRPAEFNATDASSIRVADTRLHNSKLGENKKEDYNYQENNLAAIADALGTGQKIEDIRYVQLIDGVIVAGFSFDELAFGTANPRTDIRVQPYGLSELETLTKQVTSHLWAEDYNSRYFSNGGTTKGILNLKGDADNPISPAQFEAFKRQYVAQTLGNTGAWKTPVVSIPGLEYINVQQSNREMEFEKWMNYLINICCSIYGIDPAEVNFPNRGGAGNSGGGGLGNGGIQDRIQYSRDKGLRPLLRFIEDMINQYIIYRFSDKYIFRFVGVNAKNEQEIVALQEKQAKVFKTVNEVRADNDMKPLPYGDMIEDPYFVQYALNIQAQEAQQQQLAQQQAIAGQDQPKAGVPNAPMTPIQGSSAGRVNNISPNSARGTNENTGASNVQTISNASQLDKPTTKKSLLYKKNPFLDEDKFIQIDIVDDQEQK